MVTVSGLHPAPIAAPAAPTIAELERRLRIHDRVCEAVAWLQIQAPRGEEATVATASSLLRDLLGGDTGIVYYVLDEAEQRLRPRWHTGPFAPLPVPLDGNATGRAARTRRAQLEHAVGREAAGMAPDPEAATSVALLSLPLLAGETLLGVLAAHRSSTTPFTEEDREGAQRFANQAAMALDRAALYTRLVEAEGQARYLVEQVPDAIVLHTLDGRIISANAATGELFGWEAAALAGTLLTDYLASEDHQSLADGLARIATAPPPSIGIRLRYRRPDGRPGTLSLRARRLWGPGPEGAARVQSIIRDVTGEHQQHLALETKVRELDALIEVGESLNSSLDREAILHETVRALNTVVPCPVTVIHLYDEGRRMLVPMVVDGWSPDQRPVRAVGIDDEGAIAAAVRAGQLDFVPDLTLTSGLAPLLRPDSPRAALIVPLTRNAAPLGCLTLVRPLGARFDDAEQRLAAAVARQTAIALENARLFGRVQRQLHQIGELQGLAADLVSDLDLDATLERICHTLANLLGAEKTGVRFLSEGGDQLHLAASYGFSPSLAGGLARTTSNGIDSMRALQTRQSVVTSDLTDLPELSNEEREALLAEGVVAVCTVPIIGKGQQPLGVLFATWSTPHEPASAEIGTVHTYANYAAVAIENARLFSRTRELYLATIHSLAATVDARDAYTHRHSRNVAFYAREMARELGLPQDEVETIELAALLHDIGKIGISDAILSKPSKLSSDEISVMITHAARGAAILSVNDALAPLVPLVKHHHEWYSGGGYPGGLTGDAIPLGAAIIAIADAFDTMTTDRAYRRARSLATAAQQLERGAGRQFNPQVVAAFLRVLRRDQEGGAPYILRLEGLYTTELRQGVPTLAEASQEVEDDLLGQIQPQQRRELAVLHYLARQVGAITDLSRFLEGAAKTIGRELGGHDCLLLLLDESDGDLVVHAVSGFDQDLLGRRLAAGDGIVGWVLAQGQSQMVPDLACDPRYVVWRPTSRSALGAPLISAGERIGVVALESEREAAFSADDELTLETVANQLATAVAVARLHDREKRAAITDGLTGVFNHRYFYQRLEEELARAERGGRPPAVVILDLNGLKALNDGQGHLAGDAALRMIGSLLRECTRRIDIVARYGGDEFAVILPEATVDDAQHLLTRLQARLLVAPTVSHGVTIGPLTVAAGIAAFPADGTRAAELIAAADARMYGQKRAARAPVRERAGRMSLRRQAIRRLKEQ